MCLQSGLRVILFIASFSFSRSTFQLVRHVYILLSSLFGSSPLWITHSTLTWSIIFFLPFYLGNHKNGKRWIVLSKKSWQAGHLNEWQGCSPWRECKPYLWLFDWGMFLLFLLNYGHSNWVSFALLWNFFRVLKYC